MRKQLFVNVAASIAEGLLLVAIGVCIGRYITLLEYEATIVRLRVLHAEQEPLDDGVQGKEDKQASKKTGSVKSESEEETPS